MSGTDASFLYFETPSSHMHVLGTVVLDTSTRPGWGADDLIAHLEQRLDLLPAFRRRVSMPTLWLHHPLWVDEPDVDVASHVSRVQISGGMAELADQVASFAGEQLDRRRPLWEALVVEGLDDQRTAVVFKIHHCATDGVGAARILSVIFDLGPEGRTAEELEQAREAVVSEDLPEPGVLELTRHTAAGLMAWPLSATRFVPSALRAVGRLISIRVGPSDTSGGAVPFQAPRVPFNGRITPGRVVAYAEVPLADVKAIKDAVGGTVNDAVVAMCGGALRHYLLARGELPDNSLIAVMPVSVRGQDDHSANAVSAMFTSLATDVDDPVERLAVVRQANLVAKGVHAAVGDTLLAQVTDLAPPSLTTALARAYSSLRLADLHPVVHNVVISNVPGPPIEIFLAGVRVTGLFPLGPVLEGPGLNITVVSYADRVEVGLIACSDRLPDLADLAAAVPAAVRELLDAVAPEG
jgi:WS/DGAT/MGAT family acyltransferase